MNKLLAGIDVGTTGARCIIFDLEGQVIAGAYREYTCKYPQPGWAEQDIGQVTAQTMETCREAFAKATVNSGDIASIGFSTQRCVTGPVDKHGNPVRPFISWQDTRTQREVSEMSRQVDPDGYHKIVGLPLCPNLIITKILWMRRNQPALYEQTSKFTAVSNPGRLETAW